MLTHTRSTAEVSPWLLPSAKLDGRTLMDHLWNRLDGMYPGKWRKEFPDAKSIESWQDAWAEAFTEDGITPQDVATGLKACRRLFDWPPSLVEFTKACRPYLIPENAFHDAVRGLAARKRGEMGQWAHPAIYWATVRVGRHDMEHCGYAVVRARWESALVEELSRASWEDIPLPAKALPAPGKTQATNDQANEALQRLSQSAEAVIADRGRDPRRFAKKIMAELAKKGGRRYSPTVVEMARRAMIDLNAGAQ